MPGERVNLFMSSRGNLIAPYGFNQFSEIDFFSHLKLKLLPHSLLWLDAIQPPAAARRNLKDVKLPINPPIFSMIKLHRGRQMPSNANVVEQMLNTK